MEVKDAISKILKFIGWDQQQNEDDRGSIKLEGRIEITVLSPENIQSENNWTEYQVPG